MLYIFLFQIRTLLWNYQVNRESVIRFKISMLTGLFFLNQKKANMQFSYKKKDLKCKFTFCPERYKIAPGAKKNSLHFVRCFFYLEIYSKTELNSCFMLSLYRAFIFSKKSSETSLTPAILISEADKKYMR